LRPERSRNDENSRFFNYRQHAAVYEAENQGRVGPSSTGYDNATFSVGVPFGSGQGGISAVGLAPGIDGRPGIRRGKSILAREEGMANESGLNFLKRGATLVRKKTAN
jgi:chitin synthase